ncbi:hypothetical protein CCHR01_19709 [Colletotrichum chrysophilum]|uniref:Uncharacterized protein n=1 Tax=Colletotrichum chrysophilum TaxID=1836956 RepID=A0AAD8ZZ69_9PEZI|nr:hypothetical protein CCHR01_19709 [Colletotrichum chrysophilum]
MGERTGSRVFQWVWSYVNIRDRREDQIAWRFAREVWEEASSPSLKHPQGNISGHLLNIYLSMPISYRERVEISSRAGGHGVR